MAPRLSLVPALAALLSLSASDLTGSDAIQLRVENASDLDFSSIAVGLEGGEPFGAVRSGSASAYREVGRAAEGANVRVVAAGEQCLVSPIHDGYGDVLKAGRYT